MNKFTEFFHAIEGRIVRAFDWILYAWIRSKQVRTQSKIDRKYARAETQAKIYQAKGEAILAESEAKARLKLAEAQAKLVDEQRKLRRKRFKAALWARRRRAMANAFRWTAQGLWRMVIFPFVQVALVLVWTAVWLIRFFYWARRQFRQAQVGQKAKAALAWAKQRARQAGQWVAKTVRHVLATASLSTLTATVMLILFLLTLVGARIHASDSGSMWRWIWPNSFALTLITAYLSLRLRGKKKFWPIARKALFNPVTVIYYLMCAGFLLRAL